MNRNFVSPTGSIELDNDCTYSITRKTDRSRESISKEDDLSFYYNEYIKPVYGLNNINVNNVASFMKDLEMNWSKLSPNLKDKTLNIMVDFIFNNPNANYDFKQKFMQKLNIQLNTPTSGPTTGPTTGPTDTPTSTSKSMFGFKESFGNKNNDMGTIYLVSIVLLLMLLCCMSKKKK